ncbi:MAG: hypothetical protein IJM60_03385 [Bacteroidales bacterium]|nr:hypothetical protein [Bacteroidales bacterium]
MKKAIYLLLTGLLAVCFFSCMKQDDIYKQFVVPGGLTYPQKVDTLIVRSGYNKLEIVWPKTIDPSVVKARLFWNAGQDSLDVDMTSVTDSAKIVMENLNEESYTFSVYTYDAKGNRSMVTEQAGMPYGDKYLSSKSLKEITSAAMLTTTAALFNFSPAVSDLKYCEFTYTSTSGEEKTVTLEADAKSLQITDFQNGAPYRIRSIYKPEKGIDEIPGEWVEAQETLEMEVIDLPKSPWQQFALPGDTPRYGGWGLDLYALWNNSAGDIWASPQWQYPRNTRFTIDLGYTVSLSEMQIWHRVPYETYDGSGLRNFQVWASTEPASDGGFDGWTLIGEFQAHKPSGYQPDGSPGPVTAEDNDYWVNHNVYKFVPNDKVTDPHVPVRYFRMVLQEMFGNYGKPEADTFNTVWVLAEITLRGTFTSLEERNKFVR